MHPRALLSSVLLLATLAPQRSEDWKHVEPGLALAYPRDHGNHPDHRTEWWYLTGHLATADGESFGFQFTIFRQGMDASAAREGESHLRARHVFVGHLALADPARGHLLVAERMRREGPLASASCEDLALALEDWSLARTSSDRLLLAAADAPAGIRLAVSLEPEKPLVLHGERGYSRKGAEPGNASAYASWPRLSANGTLELAGRALAVTGEAWFDHEYGTSQLGDGVVGWDWFSVQLEDGRDLMLYRFRDERGSAAPFSAGTLIDADGRPRTLSPTEFTIDSTSTWKSERSGTTYPSSWRLAVPSLAIDLRATPILPDSELDTTATTGVVYWEGPIRIDGSHAGRGYAELTGYAGSLASRF